MMKNYILLLCNFIARHFLFFNSFWVEVANAELKKKKKKNAIL